MKTGAVGWGLAAVLSRRGVRSAGTEERAQAPTGHPPAATSSRVARNFLALGGAEIVGRVVAFAATVYAARVLGAEAYGVVGFATAVMLYFGHLAAFGLDVVGVQLVAEDRGRVTTVAPALLLTRLLFAAGLAVVVGALSLAVLPTPDGMVTALFALGLVPIAANVRWIHVGLERPSVASAARVVGEVTALALLLLLVRGPADVVRVPVAQVAGATLASAMLLWWLRRWNYRLRFRLALDAVRPVVRRAWPLTLYGLLGLVLYNADLIVLRVTHGTIASGYYTAAYTLISFLANLGLAYATSLLPTLSRLGTADGGRYALYQTASAHVFAAALPAAVGGYLLAPQIVDVIFGAPYAPSVPALRILIWSVPLSVMRDLPFVALVASAREDRLLRLNATTVACSVVLMAALIPRFGLVGAAVATLCTEVIRLVIAAGFARSEGYRFAGVSRYWRVVVASLAMAALLFVLRGASVWWLVAAGSLSYVVVLALLGGIHIRRR